MGSKQISGTSIIKRSQKRAVGIFIDGPALDRASRRLKKRVDFKALYQGLSGGIPPVMASYYTLLPFEDDSRHHAFLDAIRGAGFHVIIKRLPPRGVERQVTLDVEMAADMLAFALKGLPLPQEGEEENPNNTPDAVRSVTVVCPSRELTYPLSLLKELRIDTATADFGKFVGGDILKSAAKWIDLSDSETIWRPE